MLFRSVLTASDQRWIAGAMLLWAPAVLWAAAAPVRWLESMLRADGAERSGVARDPELTQLEDLVNRVGAVAWLAAAVAMLLLQRSAGSTAGHAAGVVVLVGSFALLASAVWRRWAARRSVAA